MGRPRRGSRPLEAPLDRRTIALVALCVALFLAYPYVLRMLGLGHYLGPAETRPVATDTTRVAPKDIEQQPSLATAPSPDSGAPATATIDSAAALPEQSIEVETPLYRAWFSTRGARLQSVELKQYASAHAAASVKPRPRSGAGVTLPESQRVRLAGQPALRLDLGCGDSVRRLDRMSFAAAESLDASGAVRAITFTGRDPQGATIRQTYRIRPDDYAIDLEVEIRDVPLSWRISDYSISARSWPLEHEHDPVEEERALRASALVGTNLHREGTGGLRKAPKVFEGNVAWAA